MIETQPNQDTKTGRGYSAMNYLPQNFTGAYPSSQPVSRILAEAIEQLDKKGKWAKPRLDTLILQREKPWDLDTYKSQSPQQSRYQFSPQSYEARERSKNYKMN